MTPFKEATFELEALVIADARPNFHGSQPNLLPVRFHNLPLLIKIPQWPNFDRAAPMSLSIYVAAENQTPVKVTGRDFQGPLAPDDFPMEMNVRNEVFKQEGIYQVAYSVHIGNLMESPTIQFTIDKTTPNDNRAGELPIFPDVVIDEGLTGQYLEHNNDEVIVQIPVYPDQREGDRVYFHFGDLNETAALMAIVHASNTPTPLRLTGEVIRKKGNGNQLAYYTLEDRADNSGPRSQTTTVVVDLS
jgi:hypothetical protein